MKARESEEREGKRKSWVRVRESDGGGRVRVKADIFLIRLLYSCLGYHKYKYAIF